MNKNIRVNERTKNVTDTTDTTQANIESMGMVVGKGREELTDSLRLVGKRCEGLLVNINKHVRLRHRYFETIEDKGLYYSLESTCTAIMNKTEELRTDDEKDVVVQFKAIPTKLEAEEWNERITNLDGVKNYIVLLEQVITASELIKSELNN